MTDGRVFTIEDELDVLHDDLGRARRHLDSLERAAAEGRMVNEPEHEAARRKATERVAALERELAEMCAEQIAAAEGFVS